MENKVQVENESKDLGTECYHLGGIQQLCSKLFWKQVDRIFL